MMNIQEIQDNLATVRTGLLQFQVEAHQLIMHVESLNLGRLSPEMIPPKVLKSILFKIRKELRDSTRAALPADIDDDIWDYYRIIKARSFIYDKTLMCKLHVPLLDKSLRLVLMEVMSLPVAMTNKALRIEYTLESSHLVVTQDGALAALPSAAEAFACQLTDGFFCNLNVALTLVDRTKWCVWAMFLGDQQKIDEDCAFSVVEHVQPLAKPLGPFLWAVSPVHDQDKLTVRCPKTTYFTDLFTPVTLVTLPNSCEATSRSIVLPPRHKYEMSGPAINLDRYYIGFNRTVELKKLEILQLINRTKLSQANISAFLHELHKFPVIKAAHMKLKLNELNENYPKLKVHWPTFSWSNPFQAVFSGLLMVVYIVAIVIFCLFCGPRIYRIWTKKRSPQSFQTPLVVPSTSGTRQHQDPESKVPGKIKRKAPKPAELVMGFDAKKELLEMVRPDIRERAAEAERRLPGVTHKIVEKAFGRPAEAPLVLRTTDVHMSKIKSKK
jgi:hypothetical protein